jgi:hypothetical protein
MPREEKRFFGVVRLVADVVGVGAVATGNPMPNQNI